MKKAILFYSFTLWAYLGAAQVGLPYKNKALPVEERVRDLLRRMSPEEKFWQLFMIPGDLDTDSTARFPHGLFGFQVSAGNRGDAGGQMLSYNTTEKAGALARKINRIQRFFVEETRLGIPIIPFDEALHGLVREGATVFPQSIALAATWDTVLMHQVCIAIADETRQRGIRQVLSPVLNLATDVRWGRTEETYGEDPFLAGEMGRLFVQSFEQNGIISTPKHFLANVGEGGRDSYPIHWNERYLEEYLLPPFYTVIREGGARSLMTAYNSLDGTAASSNNWLLQEKLKRQWGFTGFVISDANAVGGEVVLHNTAKDYAESGIHAIRAGLDVIFQTEYKHHQLFIQPFLDGRIDSNRINDAVARVLKAKFELGLFENPYVSENPVSFPAHKLLAQQAATESFVLLKNNNHRLPIARSVKSIVVIGTDATEARPGGYSGPGNEKSSILDGIRERAGQQVRVSYVPGPGRRREKFTTIPSRYLQHSTGPGLQAEYFNNVQLSGVPVLIRTDAQVDFRWTLFGPGAGLDPGFYSVRWTGILKAPATGTFQIGLEGNDGFRLYINEQLIVDQWQKQSYRSVLKGFAFVKGKAYRLRVEFYEPKGNATVRLVWGYDVKDDASGSIREAVAAARQTDLAIITAGITEGEFQDRALLSLPGEQEALIRAVAATGTPVVVLLVGGSAVTMSNWIDKAAAVGTVWYPGEQGGRAVAAILFGDANPAGRTPITWPLHEGQLPLTYYHKPTGRGDDYNNLTGLPLFPFGYGLSYTRFAYSDIRLSREAIGTMDSTTVYLSVTNTGDRDGDEVVQLYIRDMLSSVARPLMELKGFQRVHIKAGETRQLSFAIYPGMLEMLNEKMERVVEPGDFNIMIGASSSDLRLKARLAVKGD